MNKYVKGKEASKILGVHRRTLYNWEKRGFIETIRTPSNHRLYNVSKYLNDQKDKKCNSKSINKICEDEKQLEENKKFNICYVRVSSHSQKDDLERQKKYMMEKYPTHIARQSFLTQDL